MPAFIQSNDVRGNFYGYAPGDRWIVTIMNAPANSPVVGEVTRPNGQTTTVTGTTDSNGTWSQSGTFAQSDMGEWLENWSVAGVDQGGYSFVVDGGLTQTQSQQTADQTGATTTTNVTNGTTSVPYSVAPIQTAVIADTTVNSTNTVAGSVATANTTNSTSDTISQILSGAGNVPIWVWAAGAVGVYMLLGNESHGRRR